VTKTIPIPIYLHNAPNPDRYLYDKHIHNRSGWSEGRVAFYAYSHQEPGTLPIYRHSTPDHERYYYDTDPHNNSGWSEGKIAFYAYSNQQPGTIPIYRHNATNPDRYYYDTHLHNTSGWSEGVVAFYAYPPGWMSTVTDNALLSQMSLPGTHESMAMYGYGSTCQEWTLAEQLRNGLRVFDIRLRYLPGQDGRVNFAVHHAHDYQHAFFDSKFPYTSDAKYFVLDDCLEFLKHNPTECIVLLIKQEKDAQVRNVFFDAFWKIIDNRAGYNNQPLDKLFYAGNTVPALRDARGRIIFAFVDGDDGSSYQLGNPRWGLYWGNIDYQVKWRNPLSGQQPGLDVENHWKDLMDWKWEKVKTHLEGAIEVGPASTIWFVTYLSASRAPALGYFPVDYAKYLLPKLQTYLRSNSRAEPNRSWGAYFGTVLMDFPTVDAISHLISASQSYQYPEPVGVGESVGGGN
jgi:hypothetical protein